MKFTEPVVELISISDDDVIVTSGFCICIGQTIDPETEPI